jgi:glycosyltransferase involved in cell wall biosynthesis
MQDLHEGGNGSITSFSTSYKNRSTVAKKRSFLSLDGDPLRPRVALVTSGLGNKFGGIGVVAQMMVSALQKDAEISVWEHPPFWPRPLRIPTIFWRTAWGSLKRVDLVIYDHVHLAVLHRVNPMLRRVPYVVFLHGIEVWLPLDGRRRDALLSADLLLTNSATTAAQARSFNPWLPKVEVTWLGVRDQPQPADISKSAPLGLMVGRILREERCKGHDAVLDAWPVIRAAIPDANLMIVGTGDDEPRLQQRIATEHIEGVKLCGWLSDADRDALYRRSRLFFFPSSGEGFGLAGVEAAGFGVPVLGLTGTVTEELFPEGTGAVFAQHLEGDSIAQAAIPVLKDPQCAATLGQTARARVQSVFLEEHFMERFRKAVSPLLHGARAPQN